MFSVLAVSANSAAVSRRVPHDTKTERATLSFQLAAPLTCADGRSASLTTSVNITADTLEDLRDETSDPSHTASVDVSRHDGCTDAYESVSLSVDDANSSNSGARSAWLEESFDLVDADSGASMGILDISLGFRGRGALRQHFERSETCVGGWNYVSVSKGVARPATLKGSVLLDGVPLFAGSMDYAAELSDSEWHWLPTDIDYCECKGTELTPEESAEMPRVPRRAIKSETSSKSAETNFRKEDAIVCEDGSAGTITSTLAVTASSDTLTENRDRTTSSLASAQFSRWNSCTNEDRTAFGSASLGECSYEQTDSASASLESAILVTDSATGSTGPVDLALDITGTGRPSLSCARRIAIDDVASTGKDSKRQVTIERTSWGSQLATVSGSAVFRGTDYAGNLELGILRTNFESHVTFER